MKNITIEEISTAYTLLENKNSKKLYVFLHGWGGSQNSFLPLAKKIQQNHNALVFDWPGFGKSEKPNEPWNTHIYAKFFYKLLRESAFEEFSEIVLYGHSFGCRVMVRHLAEQNFDTRISKIFLTGAAGINLPLPFHKKIIKKIAATTKPFKKLIPIKIQSIIRRKILRAHDWDAVSGIMKQTFSNVISEADFRVELSKIKVSTTLIWGAKDTYTSIATGEIFAEKIPNIKKFHIFPDGKHGIHNTHLEQIFQIIKP